jgi:hypothetical protein
VLLAASAESSAEFTFKQTFSFETDLRLVVDHDRGATPDQPFFFNWNRNAFDYKAQASIGDDVQGVGHLRFVFFGIHDVDTLEELTNREQMDPFRIESDAVFLKIRGFFLEHLDLQFGRMIYSWGTADQFSPTDNLNPKDFEDYLDFGGKMANQMLIATYYFPWLNWSIQGVWIPVFCPSTLPSSSILGNDPENVAMTPVRNQQLKQGVIDEYYREKAQGATIFKYSETRVNVPPMDLDNMSGGIRTKIRIGSYDLSLSYFYGRFSFPVPKRIFAFSGKDVQTDTGVRTEQRNFVDLIYPRMQVLGLDFAASLPWLFDLGVWFDLAVIHPEKVMMLLYTTNYKPGDPCATPGTRGTDIRLVCSQNSDPVYVKATAGFDYTFTKWLYVNLQYIRGFDDEFGYNDNMSNFLAGGFDLKFFNDVLLLRFFTVWDMDDMSAVLFPQMVLTKWDSVELWLGGMFNLGDLDTKFGQKASGRNIVYTKAKITF